MDRLGYLFYIRLDTGEIRIVRHETQGCAVLEAMVTLEDAVVECRLATQADIELVRRLSGKIPLLH